MPVITFGFNAENIIAKIESKQDALLEALSERMTYLMTQLQQKAQAQTKGRIRESIRNPRAEVEGRKVTGRLTWGGSPTTVSYKGGKEFDIALIYEKGAKLHAINPLRVEGGAKSKGAKARYKIGKSVLHFESERLGKEVFAAYVFHPGVVASHFMQRSLEDMKDTFKKELLSAVMGVIQK